MLVAMIGFFDSGFGGLTILRAVLTALPKLDVVYLGDNARAPYGARAGEDIVALTRGGVNALFAKGCTLVILACNTAAAVALRRLQQEGFGGAQGLPRNVLGIVVPTIEAATGKPWSQGAPVEHLDRQETILLFATERTVQAQVYEVEIAKRHAGIKVVAQACPGLADAIDRGASIDDLRPRVHEAVGRALAHPGGPSATRAILGCTHYPLIADLFAQALGPKIAIIDQAHAVAQALADYVSRHPHYGRGAQNGHRRFYSTGYDGAGLALAERFWGAPLVFAPHPLTLDVQREAS